MNLICVLRGHKWRGTIQPPWELTGPPRLAFVCDRCDSKAVHVKSPEGLQRFAEDWKAKYYPIGGRK